MEPTFLPKTFQETHICNVLRGHFRRHVALSNYLPKLNYYYYYYYYLLQLGCYPVAVVILHVNKT